jgi:hypothetical protein
VAFFPDLSEYSYSPTDKHMLNIGWLGRGESFSTGSIDGDAWDELVRLATDPVNVMRGLHDCEFCDVESPVGVPSGYAPKGFAWLGTGEIRVEGLNEACYAAPTLLLHYIKAHYYLPPSEFIQAVHTFRASRMINTTLEG